MRPMTASRRRRAHRLMTARCVIRRPTGERITDPETLRVTAEYEVVYDPEARPWLGRCKPRSFRPQEATPNVADATEVSVISEIHMPVGSVAVRPGDVITMLESRNPLIVGQHYRVRADDLVVEDPTTYRVPVIRIIGEEVPPWLPSP